MNDAEFLREGQDYELDLDDPLKDMQEFEKERRKIKESISLKMMMKTMNFSKS